MKKALGVLLTFAVGVAGLLIVKEFNYAAPTPSPTTVADQVGEGFKYVVAQIRPSLPKSIDDATSLA
jgi:hypothetical protein